MASTTLTAYTDDPCPRVEVFIDDLDSAVRSVTVYRLAGGREFRVRGAVGAGTVGALSRIDFEVPFNVEATYRAEMFDASGVSVGFTAQESITVPSAGTWMHNPLDPRGAVRVTLMESTARSLSRPVPGEISRPRGRRVGVVLAEPRQGLQGAVFDVFTETVEDADRVQAFLGDYTRATVPVVCIRLGLDAPSRARVLSPLFLGVLDVVEEPWYTTDFGGAVQRITGDEVDPPAPGLFIPLLRRMDVDASYATRGAFDAAYLRRSDADRDYGLAGAADA